MSVTHKLKRYKIVSEWSEVRTQAYPVNSEGRINVNLEFIYVNTKSPLRNRIITYNLKIAGKIFYILVLSKRLLLVFFFYHINNFVLHKLSCNVEWNLQ
jgi:hypothetical protein